MATVSVTRAGGYWIQDNSAYSNNNLDGDDWKWYLGFYNVSAQYAACCVRYLVPVISDGLQARTLTIPCSFLLNQNAGTAYASISTTAPSGTSYRYGPTSGVISNVVFFSYTAKSLMFTINPGVDISGKYIYLYLYQNNVGTATYNSLVTNSFSNGTLTYTEPFSLFADAGEGSTVDVNRTSSPTGRTGSIKSGASLYYGDILRVGVSVDSIHEITASTINGVRFVSGDTHTVTGDVSIVIVTEMNGIAHIDDGTTMEAYSICVEDGSNFYICVPHIDDGTGWSVYS